MVVLAFGLFFVARAALRYSNLGGVAPAPAASPAAIAVDFAVGVLLCAMPMYLSM
jgi:hypothetical protein